MSFDKIDKIINKINYIIIYILILLLPISTILSFYSDYFEFLKNFKYNIYDILYLIIPIEIFIYTCNIIRKKTKITIFDILLYLLIILGIISLSFSIDYQTSLWGAYLRNEGFLSIFSYYLLFLNSKDIVTKEQTKKIIKLFMIVGIMQFVWSILQVFVRGPYQIEILGGIKYMALGFNKNPNFLASYMILLLGITISSYLLNKNSKKYLFLTIIFFITLILAASTGPFFALIITLIFLILFLKIKKKLVWKKVLILIITLISTYIVTDFISDTIFINCYHDDINSNYTIKGDLKNTSKLFLNKLDKNQKTNYGSGRMVIWKNILTMVPDYMLFGSGIDTLGYIYNTRFYTGMYLDKAHNEYLQILITEGIFTLITYLTLLGVIFFKGLKCKNDLTIILFTSFIAYCIQAFANISVTTVAPFFYIITGLLVNQINKEEKLQQM